jgi:hypothetical protein
MALTSDRWPGNPTPRPATSEGSAMFTVRVISRRLHGEGIPEGEQRRGNTFQCSRDKAFELAGSGAVEILEGDDTGPDFETKGEDPSTSGTASEPASFSPAANLSATSTSQVSPAGLSSRSTTGTVSGRTAPPSTPRTSAGGATTTKKSAKRAARATDGARTAKRLGTLTSDGSNPSEPPASVAGAAVSIPGK